MNLPESVAHGGYMLIIVGTFFEGELVMLAAGVAASMGLLSLPLCIAAGMFGVFLSDTLCFAIGRFAGGRIERWFPRLHARLGGVFRLIERHDEKCIVFFQFFPGLCTVTPIAFGMTRIPLLRFVALDFVGNALWTIVFSLIGFSLGRALEYALGDVARWQTWICAVLAIGAIAWAGQRWLRAAWRP